VSKVRPTGYNYVKKEVFFHLYAIKITYHACVFIFFITFAQK